MPNLADYDGQYRPRTYFITDANTAILSKIKGSLRRTTVRVIGVTSAESRTKAESLSEDERRGVSRIHPAFMGGEYLPDLESGEVEIARLELKSVTADVISLRAGREGTLIRYRAVDEYDNEFGTTPASSTEPLTFDELVRLIDGIEMIDGHEDRSLPSALRDSVCKDPCDAQALVDFVAVTSEFYSQLAAYYDADAAEWLAEKLAECDKQPRKSLSEVAEIRQQELEISAGEPGEIIPAGQSGALTRESAVSIAAEVLTHGPADLQRLVTREALGYSEITGRKPITGYNGPTIPWDDCWVVYCSDPNRLMIKSSYVVVVSKQTGDVLYSGSAHDEG